MRAIHSFRSAVRMLLVVCTGALVACTSDTDYYDPDFMQQQAQDAFPVPSQYIDPTQTWETVGLNKVTVTMSLGLSETYDIAFYTRNPIKPGTVTELLATGKIAEGETRDFLFDAPAGIKRVFISVTDIQKHVVVFKADFDADGNATAQIGNTASTRATETTDPAFAHTCQEYLGSITKAQMEQYATFTDADIAVNNTFTNGQYDWNSQPVKVTYTVGDGHHFRVAKGTTITKTFHLNSDWGAVNQVVVYVQGKMHIKGNTFNGTTLVVAPSGEIIVDGNTQLTNTGRFIVMPGGKITGRKGVRLEVTNGQKCYNAGTIEYAGTLVVNGSDFYNCGNVKVSSLENTSQGGQITNFGHVVVDNNNADANAYNCRFVNGCYWRFTGDAGMGNLRMLRNSHLTCGGKLTLTGYTILANQSLITTQDLQVNGTSIQGPYGSSEYAVLHIKRNAYAGWSQAWSFSGMVVVDWAATGMYVNGNWTEDKGPYSTLTGFENEVQYWASESTSAVTIEASDCSVANGANQPPLEEKTPPEPPVQEEEEEDDGGFVATEEAQLPTETQAFTYMFEDMTATAGDYDFNDCVMSVTTPIDHSMTVTVWAAGGTKVIDLCLRTTPSNENSIRILAHDVTGQFVTASGRKSDGWIINTEADEDAFLPYTIEVNNLPDGFNLTQHGDFFISDSYGQVHIPAFTSGFHAGQVPYALRVPGTWAWPLEFMPITSVYLGFDAWARDATQNTDWWENGVASDYTYPISRLR